MSTTSTNQQAALKRRIRRFYDLLNRRAFARCYRMIDPRVRDNPRSVTLFQYENSARQFIEHVKHLQILRIELDLHVGEPSRLYEDRDFAVGKTYCNWTDDPTIGM